MKNPKLDKAVELATRLELHPLILMAETLLVLDPDADLGSILRKFIHQTEA
ncbi:hypothetical protein [Pseudomonas syringae group genomosp. 3]|uniref:hypothetical protein n=1 Tax=Pseudomonas syringae group genomosp. 3 TaxID=251701 RepID=UPI00160549A0|nr:hypothetical protein [Pseudomonas syringae group genomosp. 3]